MTPGRRPGAGGAFPPLTLLAGTTLAGVLATLTSLAPGAGLTGGLTVLVLGLAAAALVAPWSGGPVAVATAPRHCPHLRSWPDGEPPRQQHPDTPGRVRPRAPGRD